MMRSRSHALRLSWSTQGTDGISWQLSIVSNEGTQSHPKQYTKQNLFFDITNPKPLFST